jgi:SRSO17 transposase
LYLPKEWTDDPDRLEATYVPADVGFATKPKLATRMIARAIAASIPFKWVAGDTVYGVGNIEQQLRRAGKGYVLGVSSAHVFRSWGKRPPVAGTAADLARTRRSSDWKRLSAGAGTKGPRLHGWCYLELADLEAEQFNSANDGLWTRGLLIRRRIADDDLAPSSPPGAQREQPLKRWSRSKAIDGRSRTPLKPRKTSSGSITTRADPGMAGTVMCPW